jgi:hypothetical protein
MKYVQESRIMKLLMDGVVTIYIGELADDRNPPHIERDGNPYPVPRVTKVITTTSSSLITENMVTTEFVKL